MAQHPTEEILNITRKFLGGELQGGGPERDVDTSTLETGRALPGQAASTAKRRAFGQQGTRQTGRIPAVSAPNPSLSSAFFGLPGPVGFSKTPQGQAILQRILGRFGRGGLR